MATLTMRERMLAVIKGEQLDLVPFAQFDGLAGPNEEIWDHIGRGEMGLIRWTRLHRVEHPNCQLREERITRAGVDGIIFTIETPRGELVEERYLEPTYGTAWIDKHYVSEPDDYDAFLAYMEDAVVVEDLAAFAETRRDFGDDGIPIVRLDRTPYQQLWIEWAGIDNLALHLADCPDRVEAALEALGRRERRLFELVAKASPDLVNFPDNITAPIISPANFQRCCVPFYDELVDMLGDEVLVVSHMDGDLRPLWEAIGESKLGGLDSLTPPPDNDTSPGDVVSMWPQMRIFANFPSSLHHSPPPAIYAQASEMLEQAGHSGRLQIQISENIPPGAWKVTFPEIVRAIHDFGKP